MPCSYLLSWPVFVILPDLSEWPPQVTRNISPTIHRPQTALITEPTIRSMVERFIGVGETVFDVVQASAVNSSYWKRSSR